jgi:hypothetical protein
LFNAFVKLLFELNNVNDSFRCAVFLYYILLFFIIFKIVNIKKIYFLKFREHETKLEKKIG